MPEKNRFPAVLVRQWPSKTACTLSASFGNKLGLENQHINEGAPLFVLSQLGAMQIRRLTPRECERLQGFPDDWTNVSRNGKPAPDGPRYKAIGNSMAVPVMRWIGQRIQMVENVANG
jgi:DNA (cytosine-5)-methyltransferase 1